MVETYNGKSPRNARIKIDYTGECPSVKFQYPRKDGYVGSMMFPILTIWLIFIWISFTIFASGIILGAETILQNNSQVNDINISINNYEKESIEETTFIFKDFKQAIIVILIVFVPPILINKLFKKRLNALFPVYQAWKSKKKYVTFKNKDIKTSKINRKEEIYVEIPYFENVILKYEATKDFSKYLDVMEIKEHNFKIEESPKKKKGKKMKKGKVKKQNEWYWYAKFYFNKIPKEGKVSVVYK